MIISSPLSDEGYRILCDTFGRFHLRIYRKKNVRGNSKSPCDDMGILQDNIDKDIKLDKGESSDVE